MILYFKSCVHKAGTTPKAPKHSKRWKKKKKKHERGARSKRVEDKKGWYYEFYYVYCPWHERKSLSRDTFVFNAVFLILDI